MTQVLVPFDRRTWVRKLSTSVLSSRAWKMNPCTPLLCYVGLYAMVTMVGLQISSDHPHDFSCLPGAKGFMERSMNTRPRHHPMSKIEAVLRNACALAVNPAFSLPDAISLYRSVTTLARALRTEMADNGLPRGFATWSCS